MIFKKYLYFAAIALFAFASCKKDPQSGMVDVYVFGEMATTSAQTPWLPTYWKNGTPHQAGKIGDYIYFSQNPNAIAVSGDDIYIAGKSYTAGLNNNNITTSTAVYWKNGVPVSLPSGPDGEADAIAVSGNDVYACGYSTNVASGFLNATYWKNGNLVRLNDSKENSFAEGIAVHDNDIYVIGHIYTQKGEYIGVVWKNGVATTLSNAIYSSIAINKYSVYIAGSVITTQAGNRTPTYWKNGIATILPFSTVFFVPNLITFTNNDMYITGFVDTKTSLAGYWKNGVGYGVSSNNLTAIASDGTDIYYLAHRMDGQFSSPYWIYKNGVEISITSDIPNGYELYGIGVVRH